MKKLLALTLICVMLALVAGATIVSAAPSEQGETQGNHEKEIGDGLTEDEKHEKNVSAADGKEDRIGPFEYLRLRKEFGEQIAELKRLCAECLNGWKQVFAMNAKIRTAWRQLVDQLRKMEPEERQQALADLREELVPLRQQLKDLYAQIEALRQEKRAAWVAFREAVKNRDVAAAHAALEDVITAKSEILDRIQSIKDIKEAIWEAIKNAKN